MKKFLIALGIAAALTTAVGITAHAETFWKYNDTMTIDMEQTHVKTTKDGHEVLEFVGVETLPDNGTCTYTYVYDRTAGTIQVKEMEKRTKKLHYTSNFAPESIIPRTRSLRIVPLWQKLYIRERPTTTRNNYENHEQTIS